MLAFIRDNIRFPDNAMGDMRSQLAACRLGERRFVELIDRYGKSVVQEAIDTILRRDRAEVPRGRREDPGRHVRGRELHRLATATGYDIRVKVIVSGSDMTIDLSGCSPEREGGSELAHVCAARTSRTRR